MTLKNKKGFTLIELMVAVAITGVVIFLAGIIHITSINLWIKGSDKVFLQEETSFVWNILTTAIRDATEEVEILDNGQKLKLTREDINGNLIWEKTFYKDNNDLSYITNNEAKKALISNILHSLTFFDQDKDGKDLYGGVRVEMVLQKGNEKFVSEKTVDMRNYGLREVYNE